MSVHRPLSDWIAFVTGTYGELGPVNGGQHRLDARHMRRFHTGWSRVAVPLANGTSALGLRDATGTTAVELDDQGMPIAVSAQGLNTLRQLEKSWPRSGELVADLGEETLPLRYWLLDRMAEEGSPPDDAFSILPWRLLDGLVEAISTGLESSRMPRIRVEARHWLTPAIKRVTGPLEQIDEGLRTGSRFSARQGVSRLLDSLCNIGLSRVPEASRARLRVLVNQIGEQESTYRHAAGIAAARLAGEQEIPRIQTTLTPTMEAAAGRDLVRSHTERLGDDDQWVRVTKRQAGRVRLTAHISTGGRGSLLFGLRGPGSFLPVSIRPRHADEPIQLWIALYQEAAALVGSIELTVPRGQSELTADTVPVEAEDLAHLPLDTLRVSLSLNSTLSQNSWAALAAELHEDHPVRRAWELWHDI